MALELQKFIEDLEAHGGNGNDEHFLRTILDLVRIYRRTKGDEESGTEDERVKEGGPDMSKIPYDTSATDGTTLLKFVARLDLPIRIKLSLARHVGWSEQQPDWATDKILSIEDLYRVYGNGQLSKVRNVGEKSELVIGKCLVVAQETGSLLPENDLDFRVTMGRLMADYKRVSWRKQ